ncbi:MAG: acyl-CoA synthetase [Rhizobiales bacterium 65-9]|nr:fatty acid--CoA ligase [Hyphomicrobiales bacterium]OJY32404.1 MAG: acyl-CoA synthetase [Rhizobiales bacterium 65-9]
MEQTIPIKTLAELPPYQARALGAKRALRFEGRDTSFAEFDRHTAQVANGLMELGLKRGDRIAYLGRNSDWYFELLFGAIRAGIVLSPIGWRLADPEILFILENSQAKALFVEHEFLRPAITDTLPATVTTLIAMDKHASKHERFDAWRDRQSNTAPDFSFEPDDVAVQIYTSGTTGRPKGAMLTHRNFIRMRELLAAQGSESSKYYPDDIALQAMPVSHVGGTSTGVWALYHGISSVVARQFDPDDVLGFIRDEGVNSFFLVPAALQRIARDPRAQTTDFSRLRFIIYGGSPMPRELLAECMKVFKCGFLQGYGMTETCATIVQLPPEDHVLDDNPRLRSAGKALPGVEIAIRGDDGAPLPAGTVGEIVIRSPGNMVGYWNDPEATAKTIDPDGWLHSGDAGYLDDDGYLFIVDRVKDMIVSGGENIYPAEVENAIYGHPDVSEVVVIGVPSDRWGEEVKAMVVAKPGADPKAESIIDWAKKHIASFKAPKSVDFIAALPKSGAGKVLRREVRDPFWKGRDRKVN